MQSKFSVKITRLAYNILLSFLMQQDFQFVTSIINEKIRFEKVQDSISLACDQEYNAVLPGYIAGNAAQIVPGCLLRSFSSCTIYIDIS